jgi:hypothetical protein
MSTTSSDSQELLKTLQALVAAYEAMPFINRYPLAENIEDIKAHVEKLRGEGAADMQAETAAERAASLEARRQAYPPVLPVVRKYQVTIGAGVRAYATITVEAPDEDVAWNKARTTLQILQDSMGKMVEFEADYETLHDLELLEDLVDITDH